MDEPAQNPELQPSESPPETPPPEHSGVDRGMDDANICPNCGWPNGPNRVICEKCQARLPVVKRPALPELPSRTRSIHFVSGLAGWYLLNILPPLTFGFDLADEGDLITQGLCIFPANVFALFFLAISRKLRWIALGVLAAWGLNLLISLALGVVGNGYCLVPFFIK